MVVVWGTDRLAILGVGLEAAVLAVCGRKASVTC